MLAYYEIVEEDVELDPRANWQQGPAYPDGSQYDLETVLLHELGHFYDFNAPHAYGCEQGPMWENLDTGEWWRYYNDWHRNTCVSPRTRARAASRPRLVVHNQIVGSVYDK